MCKIKIPVFIICIILLLVGCNRNPQEDVVVNRENSALQDFYVEGDSVHMICRLEVQNTCYQDVAISITGSSQEDVDGGLLASPELLGSNLQTNNVYFWIPAGAVQKIDVDFCGIYGGVYQKADRLIPDGIDVKIAETALPQP